MFKPVPNRIDYVALEHDVQAWWDANDIAEKYMARNQDAAERWSFIDGPITANNPMGVHHAWGRSYKDLYNRFWTMRGRKLRYQNGFDCQGLWIEVEVEKELGFTSKKDIEKYGVAKFVEDCKERVRRFSAIQTEQSKRLGYWMHWDNSYYTNSDENNYTIWGFLKKVHEKGWLYKGKDSMPWCPRCGTGISQHEIVTEGYKDITHQSVFVRYPLLDRAGESLLVWTTTPWTLAANVAAAVNPDLSYVKVRQNGEVLYVSQGALAKAIKGEHEVLGEVKGSDLVGLRYSGPFDELPAQDGIEHRVIDWDEVSDEEGTGIVHIAPGAGAEDFALSKTHNLPVIAPLDEDGTYLVNAGFGPLEGRFAGDVPSLVFESLREKGILHRVESYLHRYPTCWRCGSELVFRLVDEWFISMDELRHKIMDVTRKARWIPEFGLAREIDWLRNMHDWMISKKRYYGLALPIYECKECGKVEVIGSETELHERAIEGWAEFEGHSPHRPYVDAVKIACSDCGATIERIKDVGNPWLDAGIVPFSTLEYRHDHDYFKQWFPADWVSESFPGQFRNWFYSLLAMGTVMALDTEFEGEPPFLNLFSYALLRDEKGDEMHKSKGNAIWFEDAAEKMGVDVMRWMYLRQPPANNLNFGYGYGDEIKRNFLSTLWNTYSFFVTYANIDGWTPGGQQQGEQSGSRAIGQSGSDRSGDLQVATTALSELDRWVLSELNQLVASCTNALENYDALTTTRAIEDFVEGLSNWYVRRSRRRFWKSESDDDKQAAYATLYTCLETLTRLMAPLTPFLAEELYQNLTRSWDAAARESVHLLDWPQVHEELIDERLSKSVEAVRKIVSLGRAGRARANLKVRQPLRRAVVRLPSLLPLPDIQRMRDEIEEELNVKVAGFLVGDPPQYVADDSAELAQQLGRPAFESDFFEFKALPNLPLLGPKHGSDIGRIRGIISAADPSVVANSVRSGLPIDVGGVTFQPNEVLVSIDGKPGYVAVEESGYAVAIATEVTQELADEGLAREIVRRVQEMRKSAGFDIADRIRLAYEGDAELSRVMHEWGEYIRQETLASELVSGDTDGYREEHDLDGSKAVLSVRKIT